MTAGGQSRLRASQAAASVPVVQGQAAAAMEEIVLDLEPRSGTSSRGLQVSLKLELHGGNAGTCSLTLNSRAPGEAPPLRASSSFLP